MYSTIAAAIAHSPRPAVQAHASTRRSPQRHVNGEERRPRLALGGGLVSSWGAYTLIRKAPLYGDQAHTDTQSKLGKDAGSVAYQVREQLRTPIQRRYACPCSSAHLIATQRELDHVAGDRQYERREQQQRSERIKRRLQRRGADAFVIVDDRRRQRAQRLVQEDQRAVREVGRIGAPARGHLDHHRLTQSPRGGEH